MNIFSKSLWEPIIGLWSLVHVLFGVVIALFFVLFNGSFVIGLITAFVLASGWEILEVIFDGHENYLNRVVDVIVASVGYLVIYCIYTNQNISQEILNLSLWIFTLIFILGSVVGWIAYLRYNNLNKK